MLGGSGAYASSLGKFCAIWCVLVYILIRLCFVLYFEGILNKKWLLSHRNNYISYRDARGFGDMLPQKIEMIDAIWCVLMYYFDQITS